MTTIAAALAGDELAITYRNIRTHIEANLAHVYPKWADHHVIDDEPRPERIVSCIFQHQLASTGSGDFLVMLQRIDVWDAELNHRPGKGRVVYIFPKPAVLTAEDVERIALTYRVFEAKGQRLLAADG